MATVAILAVAGLIVEAVLPKPEWVNLYFSILAGTPVYFLGCLGAAYLRRHMAWNVRNDSPVGWLDRLIINRTIVLAAFILAFAFGATLHWALASPE